MIALSYCKKLPTLCILFLMLLSLYSCSSVTESNSIDLFFESIELEQQGETKKTIKNLDKIINSSDTAIGEFSLEYLVPLLYESEDFEEVIALTKNRIYSTEEEKSGYSANNNLLYRFLILSLIRIESLEVIENIEEWLLVTSFSNDHNLFFHSKEFEKYAETHEINQDLLIKIAIKQSVYSQSYLQACEIIESSIDDNNELLFFTNKDEYYLSDIGKALLYGTDNTLRYAEILEIAAEEYGEKSEEAFMCNFYSGRLYEKSKTFIPVAVDMFEKAVKSSTNEKHFDNALWYYLSVKRKMSTRQCIDALLEYAPQWHDPYYFDDLLDILAFQLLDIGNYKGFYALYNAIENYMSPESVSKYAYMSALFIQQGYLDAEFEDESEKEKTVISLFEKAFNAKNGSFYYRIMAAYELDISSNDTINNLLTCGAIEKKNIDNSFEAFITKLTENGYIDEAYSLYMKNSDIVSLDCASQIAQSFLLVNNPSVQNEYRNNYYTEALRLVSQAIHSSEKNIPFDVMQLLYPKHYSEFVIQVSETYEIEEYIIYALMRSESFFDYDIESWAGAIGLTQLMPTTAQDVARKLKVSEYDLHNPRQNIDFGIYYLDELLPRFGVDNSMLRAFFAYNAGITNLRRWEKTYSSVLENVPLFLESIPFAETREYGRKLLSAGVMYSLLHYDLTLKDAVESIMN